MNHTRKYLVAATVALLIGGSRFWYETALVRSVQDAQGAIWLAYSLFVSVLTVLVTFLLVFECLYWFERERRLVGTIFLVAAVALGGWTANTMLWLADVRQALADAANPQITPQRLRDLVGYPTGFGYEIDNRIAANRNTPLEVLRLLHEKHQLGTDIALAKNPRTPDDVLRALAHSEDHWIQRALRFNPRYREIAGVVGPQEP